MLYDVFLSYSSSDKDSAARLSGALERSGLSVWWDAKLTKDIPFDKQIKDALAQSVAIVAIISPHALKSKWVRWELAQAPAGGMLVVPVLIGDISDKELPGPVAAFCPILWREPVDSLAADIDDRIRRLSTTKQPSILTRDPSQRELIDHISIAASQSVQHRSSQTEEHPQSMTFDSSDGLASFFVRHGLSVAFSSMQSNAICFVHRTVKDQIALSSLSFPRPIGLCAARDRLHVSTQNFYHKLVAVAGKRPGEICYLPRISYFTGALDIHDLRVLQDGEPVFANTRFNCLSTLSTRTNFRAIWKPVFLDDIIDGDTCHLNGLATSDNHPTFCTLVSPSSHLDGWREDPIGRGMVIDIENDRVACNGLTFPHSPRNHNGRLWLLNSGEGEFGFIRTKNESANCFTSIAQVPGFARGLAFHGRFAFIGISKSRYGLSDRMPVHRRMQEVGKPAWCGFHVIDTETGKCLEWFRFSGKVPHEISSIEVIGETTGVEAYDPDSEIASEHISWET